MPLTIGYDSSHFRTVSSLDTLTSNLDYDNRYVHTGTSLVRLPSNFSYDNRSVRQNTSLDTLSSTGAYDTCDNRYVHTGTSLPSNLAYDNRYAHTYTSLDRLPSNFDSSSVHTVTSVDTLSSSRANDNGSVNTGTPLPVDNFPSNLSLDGSSVHTVTSFDNLLSTHGNVFTTPERDTAATLIQMKNQRQKRKITHCRQKQEIGLSESTQSKLRKKLFRIRQRNMHKQGAMC